MKKIKANRKPIACSNRRSIMSANSYGWEVDEREAWEAYEFACDYMGKEYVDDAIVNTLSVDDVASSLAYLFRMWDFREWEDRNEEAIEGSTGIGKKKTWYIFDSESNILINNTKGFEDRSEAIKYFKSRYTEDQARDYGFTLCKVLEDGETWYECLEELTPDDIYSSTNIFTSKKTRKRTSKKNVTGKKPVKASSEKLFYGVPGVKFIWHGEWSDPEVEYEGEVYNYYDLEDALYSEYKEICAEEGTSCTDKGFENWVHENPDVVYGWLYDLEPVAEAKPEITRNDIGSVLTRWGLKK